MHSVAAQSTGGGECAAETTQPFEDLFGTSLPSDSQSALVRNEVDPGAFLQAKCAHQGCGKPEASELPDFATCISFAPRPDIR